MAKLTSMFFILIALQVALILYATAGNIQGPCTHVGSGDECNSGYICSNMTMGSTQCVKSGESTFLWSFITDFVFLSKWTVTDLLTAICGIAASLAISTIIAGSVFKFITDFIVLAPAVAGILTIGVVFTNFANFMRNFLSQYVFVGCITGTCAASTLLTAAIVGPLAFYFAWTVFDWWRGKDN